MLSQRYLYSSNAKSVYPDTPERKKAIERLCKKLENDQYKLEDVPCPCGEVQSEVLAERDRFAISTTTVICPRCGLVRINPRMDEASYARFYDEEFRDIATLAGSLAYQNGIKGRVKAIYEKEWNCASEIYKFISEIKDVKGFTSTKKARARVVDGGWTAI